VLRIGRDDATLALLELARDGQETLRRSGSFQNKGGGLPRLRAGAGAAPRSSQFALISGGAFAGIDTSTLRVARCRMLAGLSHRARRTKESHGRCGDSRRRRVRLWR
jgi:hypothetical protein